MMDLNYKLIRSARKTVSLRITPEGGIEVRCPNRMRRGDVDAFVRSKQGWIETHLAKLPPARPKLTEKELEELRRRAKEILPQRVDYYARLIGVTYGTITVRSQRTRWGSCSSKGNLNFNCLLMLTSPEILDYVVVHELCHRKELNHSARFWAQVERILPDYRIRRKWLKDNANALIGRLPD
jgi:predicted metal-dependent hydrolase